ncbi:hypothetical protein D3C85_1507460 [compost metagenome]
MRDQTNGHDGRQLLDPTFRNGVSNRCRVGEHSVDGRHVDDRTFDPFFDHDAGCSLADQKRRLQVNALSFIKGVFGIVNEVRGDDNSGVVYDNIQRAKVIHCLCYNRLGH